MRKLILALGIALAARAQNAVPVPIPEIQFFTNAGQPLAGGFLCTYAAGTTTPQASYTDATGGTPNSNPVVLNSAGRASLWGGLAFATYKLVLYSGGNGSCPGSGTVLWSQDAVPLPGSGGGGGGGAVGPNLAVQYSNGSGGFLGTSAVEIDANGNLSIGGSGSVLAINGVTGGVDITAATSMASIQSTGGAYINLGNGSGAANATVGLTIEADASPSANLVELYQRSGPTLTGSITAAGLATFAHLTVSTVSSAGCAQFSNTGVLSSSGTACGGTGSSPAGNNLDVQYNASGVFGATDNVQIDANGNLTLKGTGAQITIQGTAGVGGLNIVGAPTTTTNTIQTTGGITAFSGLFTSTGTAGPLLKVNLANATPNASVWFENGDSASTRSLLSVAPFSSTNTQIVFEGYYNGSNITPTGTGAFRLAHRQSGGGRDEFYIQAAGSLTPGTGFSFGNGELSSITIDAITGNVGFQELPSTTAGGTLKIAGTSGDPSVQLDNGYFYAAAASGAGFNSNSSEYNSIQAGNGGMYALSFIAANYIETGFTASGLPPLTGTSGFNPGSLFWDKTIGALQVCTVNGGCTTAGQFKSISTSSSIAGVSSVNSATGALTVTGTTNEISVSTVSTTITLSTPQPIALSSTVGFGSVEAGCGSSGATSGIFESCATGASIAFETSGGTFLVNGAGAIETTISSTQAVWAPNGTLLGLNVQSTSTGANSTQAYGGFNANAIGTGASAAFSVNGSPVINTSDQFVGVGGVFTVGGGNFGAAVSFSGGLGTAVGSSNSTLYTGTGNFYTRDTQGNSSLVSCSGINDGWLAVTSDDYVVFCHGGARFRALASNY